MNTVLKVVLFAVALGLTFLIYHQIVDYPAYNKKIKIIYRDAIEHLMDVRTAQILYKEKTDSFASDFNTLNEFVKTEKFFSEDSTVLFTVKDSVFGDREPSGLGKINTINGNVAFNLYTDRLKNKNDTLLGKSIFVVSATKETLLKGFQQEFIDRERLQPQNNNILEDSLYIGSFTSEDTEGNWTNGYEVMVAKKQNR